MAEVFGADISKTKMKIYWDILSQEMTTGQFEAASNHLLKTWKPDFGRKFPAPAEFLEIFKPETPEEEFDRQWASIQESPGNLSSGDFTEAFKKLMLAQGGSFNLVRWEEKDWHFNRGRLKDAYVATLQKKKKDDLMLPSKEEASKLIGGLSKKFTMGG